MSTNNVQQSRNTSNEPSPFSPWAQKIADNMLKDAGDDPQNLSDAKCAANAAQCLAKGDISAAFASMAPNYFSMR